MNISIQERSGYKIYDFFPATILTNKWGKINSKGIFYRHVYCLDIHINITIVRKIDEICREKQEPSA